LPETAERCNTRARPHHDDGEGRIFGHVEWMGAVKIFWLGYIFFITVLFLQLSVFLKHEMFIYVLSDWTWDHIAWLQAFYPSGTHSIVDWTLTVC
jgi:hypothetical protein